MKQMFSLDEIVSAVNGQLIIGSDCKMDGTVYVSGVSKDTRTINPGELYVALVGENFDGHSFCAMALEKGASVLLVSDASFLPTTCLAVLVEDTRVALGQLAKNYRFKLAQNGTKVIAVTGSVGKTSTREMIAAGLSASLKVYSTKANLNNDIGLPMTILSAPMDTEVLIVEMGMRLRGEISYLTNIACPDIAVITNVGFCHIERLGSQNEILLAKCEILEGLVPGGVIAINGDDKLLTDYIRENASYAHVIASANVESEPVSNRFGVSVKAMNVDITDEGTKFDIKVTFPDRCIDIQNILVKAHGVHHVRNAIFAFVCAAILNGDFDSAREGVASYVAMAGRGLVKNNSKITVIDDAYNAAPESMELAFANLEIIAKTRRKVAVIGGMLELGDYSPMLHERVGEFASKYSIDKFFVMGDDAKSFVKGLEASGNNHNYEVFDDLASLETSLKSYLEKDDVVLFKASNAFGFQKLAQRIYEEVN